MKKLFSIALMLICTAVFSQAPVSKSIQPRKAVIESFSGIHNEASPASDKAMDQVVAKYPGQVILINVHAGTLANDSGKTDFKTPIGSYIYSKASPAAWFHGMVNRNKFGSSSQIPIPFTLYEQYTDSVTNDTSEVNIGMTAKYKTPYEVELDVSVYYTFAVPKDQYLHVYALQDSIEAYQYDPQNAYPDRVVPGGYLHMNALRGSVTGKNGEPITSTAKGDQSDFTFTYSVSQVGNIVPVLENLKFVAFVTTDSTLSEIVNAEETKPVDFYLGINDLTKNTHSLPKFYEVYTLSGQKVKSGDGKYDVSDIPSGFYIIRQDNTSFKIIKQ